MLLCIAAHPHPPPAASPPRPPSAPVNVGEESLRLGALPVEEGVGEELLAVCKLVLALRPLVQPAPRAERRHACAGARRESGAGRGSAGERRRRSGVPVSRWVLAQRTRRRRQAAAGEDDDLLRRGRQLQQLLQARLAVVTGGGGRGGRVGGRRQVAGSRCRPVVQCLVGLAGAAQPPAGTARAVGTSWRGGEAPRPRPDCSHLGCCTLRRLRRPYAPPAPSSAMLARRGARRGPAGARWELGRRWERCRPLLLAIYGLAAQCGIGKGAGV